MPEYTYEVHDPLLGFVSCENLAHARTYAAQVIGGAVFRSTWENGEQIGLERIEPKHMIGD